MMDQQFSRFLRANANVDAYRDALRLAAAAHGVPVLRRWDLMRHWADNDQVDLERAGPQRTRRGDRPAERMPGAGDAGLLRDGVAEARGRPGPRP